MNLKRTSPRRAGAAGWPRGARGFSLMEMVVAMSIVLFIAGAFAVFTEATGRSLTFVSAQSEFNQKAGHGAEFIVSRIRLANTVSNDASGNTLTLSYDDDPEVDSDGDGITWNDRNHAEQLQFVDSDGSTTTLLDNTIIYRTNASAGMSSTLVPQSVRKLSGLPVFAVTNTSTVLINFGLLYTNSQIQSQAIEIRTKARLRNKTQ